MKKIVNLLSFLGLCAAYHLTASDKTMHTIFVPGVSASINRVNAYVKAGAFAGQKHSNIVFPDQKKPKKFIDKIIYRFAKKRGRTVNRSKIVLGNRHDITTIEKAVQSAKNQEPNTNGILFGTCRGASVIIQYLSQNNAEWVKGIVLDSPFADPNVLLKDRVTPALVKILLPKFNPNAPTPLEGIKRIKNKKVKILLLFAEGNHSKGGQIKGDTVTPFNKHIKPLYDEFKRHGFDVTMCGYKAEHCGGIDSEKDMGDQKVYLKQLHKWYQNNGFRNP
ncbi:hypothetical protein HYV10_02655 [Candidatus Dependentiae bacterium]|nr:hypothetical protein [Candidatus Dependentiae bacterium]